MGIIPKNRRPKVGAVIKSITITITITTTTTRSCGPWPPNLIMIEKIKPYYNACLRPLAKACVRWGIHPNAVTLAGVALYAIGGSFIYMGFWKLAVLVGTIGGFMDGLDGLVAREYKKESPFGAIFDSFCDRLTEIAIYLGVLAYYLNHPAPYHLEIYAAFLVITGSMLVSYIKARANAEGIACSGGFAQRSERLIAIGILLLSGPGVMVWGLAGLAACSYFTAFWRLYRIYVNLIRSRK